MNCLLITEKVNKMILVWRDISQWQITYSFYLPFSFFALLDHIHYWMLDLLSLYINKI